MSFHFTSKTPPGTHMMSPKEWGLLNYSNFDMTDALQLMNECWPVVLSLVSGYLTMVFFVKPLRHPYWNLLKNIRQSWNTGLAVFSLIGSLHVVTHLLHSMVHRGIYASLTQHDESFFKGPTGFWLLLFVLGKIVELGDTVLLLLSGRKLSFLHWFHHSTVLTWCWYELQAKTPMHHFCMAVNYTVHTFMYGYFALNDTFDDPTFRRRWGMRITGMQCSQFLLDLTAIAIGAYSRLFHGNEQISLVSLCLSSSIITSYLILFLQFAEEKYGFYSQFRHALWRSRTSKTSSSDCVMPWHRTDLSMEQRFEEATKMAVMLSYVATPHDLLTLYGTFKIARSGPIPALLKEPQEDERSRAKWNAWNQASKLTKDEAMQKYIEMLDTLADRSNKAQEKTAKANKAAAPVSMEMQNADPFVLYPVKIVGHGAYHPKRIVYNEDVEKKGGLTISSQEKKRTGVIERRWVDIDGGENLIQNGAKAVRRACASAGVALDELDLIVGSFGGHQFLPDDACLVQRELGLGESGIRAFTVHATCLSFLVAMEVAGSLMREGKYRKVAVFASSIASVGLNPKDPHTAGLFGDGAAAVILQPSDCASAIHRVHMETYGCGADTCRIEGHGTNRPCFSPNHKKEMDFFKMDGEATLSLISKYVRGVLTRCMPGLERGLNDVQVPGYDKLVDVDWVIPHQASAVGINSLGMFGWPDKKVLKTIHKFGNTIAASIPLTLCDHIDNGTIKRGDKILICGTSAGLSCAAMLFTY